MLSVKFIKIPLALLLVASNQFQFACSKLEQAKMDNSFEKDSNLSANQSELLQPPIGLGPHNTENSSFTDVGPIQIGRLDLRANRDMYTNEQMEFLYKFLTDVTQFHGSLTISELQVGTISARSHGLIYDDMLMHRYDSYAMLKQSTGPHVDQDVCINQLQQLIRKLDEMEESKLNSRDLNFYRLLDTYGRALPGLTVANVVWLGMYAECLSLKIELLEGEMPTRYCLAAVKHKSWPKDNQLSKILAFKAGVCLPRACNSLKYQNKYELIQRLMDFNAREVDKGETFLDNLYCLPDDDSPMQMWWKSPKTLQAVIVFSCWIAILVYATVKYERMKNSAQDQAGGSSDKLLKLGLTAGFKLETGPKELGPGATNSNFKIYKMLAITHNLQSLFDTKSRTAAAMNRKEPGPDSSAAAKQSRAIPDIIDLRCLEGIKVICMSYVIMGHVLMCITRAISNGREMATTSSPTFIMANLMPAFAVNAFFAITGILTSYLLFKQNEKHSFFTNPLKWATLVMYRYLRIMPMYVVVVYYCKYISKFIGSGPLWDYGTSSLAHRRQCEEEHWLWTILFGANFKPPFAQCIPSAWYLANDFQFFVVTPIFLAALHKSPVFGQRLLKFCIAAGYFAGIISMLSSGATDTRPIAKFMPHGFKTYVTFFTESYTRPHYRIPAYLCGLLFGYQLYVYEQDKLKYLREAAARKGLKEPDWSESFLERGSQISLVSMLLCAVIPIIGAQLPFNKFFANLLAAVVMPSYHIVFALGVGLYILLATTGHGNKSLNRCLSAPFWKPLARLSLCAVLINIEVVNYIIQSSKQQVYVDFFTHSSLNLLGIVVTYLAAIVVFVLFEAPIKAALNELIGGLLTLANSKHKEQ